MIGVGDRVQCIDGSHFDGLYGNVTRLDYANPKKVYVRIGKSELYFDVSGIQLVGISKTLEQRLGIGKRFQQG